MRPRLPGRLGPDAHPCLRNDGHRRGCRAGGVHVRAGTGQLAPRKNSGRQPQPAALLCPPGNGDRSRGARRPLPAGADRARVCRALRNLGTFRGDAGRNAFRPGLRPGHDADLPHGGDAAGARAVRRPAARGGGRRAEHPLCHQHRRRGRGRHGLRLLPDRNPGHQRDRLRRGRGQPGPGPDRVGRVPARDAAAGGRGAATRCQAGAGRTGAFAQNLCVASLRPGPLRPDVLCLRDLLDALARLRPGEFDLRAHHHAHGVHRRHRARRLPRPPGRGPGHGPGGAVRLDPGVHCRVLGHRAAAAVCVSRPTGDPCITGRSGERGRAAHGRALRHRAGRDAGPGNIDRRDLPAGGARRHRRSPAHRPARRADLRGQHPRQRGRRPAARVRAAELARHPARHPADGGAERRHRYCVPGVTAEWRTVFALGRARRGRGRAAGSGERAARLSVSQRERASDGPGPVLPRRAVGHDQGDARPGVGRESHGHRRHRHRRQHLHRVQAAVAGPPAQAAAR